MIKTVGPVSQTGLLPGLFARPDGGNNPCINSQINVELYHCVICLLSTNSETTQPDQVGTNACPHENEERDTNFTN